MCDTLRFLFALRRAVQAVRSTAEFNLIESTDFRFDETVVVVMSFAVTDVDEGFETVRLDRLIDKRDIIRVCKDPFHCNDIMPLTVEALVNASKDSTEIPF